MEQQQRSRGRRVEAVEDELRRLSCTFSGISTCRRSWAKIISLYPINPPVVVIVGGPGPAPEFVIYTRK